MAPFAKPEVHRLDWLILRQSSIAATPHPREFEAALQWFRQAGYLIHQFDSSDWERFRDQVTEAFDFVGNFGYAPWTGNLDAFEDAVFYLAVPDEVGMLLSFPDFDELIDRDPRFAREFLDSLDRGSRNQLVYGRRLITLIVSERKGWLSEPLGVRSILSISMRDIPSWPPANLN